MWSRLAALAPRPPRGGPDDRCHAPGRDNSPGALARRGRQAGAMTTPALRATGLTKRVPGTGRRDRHRGRRHRPDHRLRRDRRLPRPQRRRQDHHRRHVPRADLARPAGTIEVYGETPHRAVADGRVSAVMQTGGLLPDFTVRETIRAIAALHGRPERVDVVVERAGLGPLADRLVKACSGGEQQRLKFALALVPDPDLVILDEPTTGMDVGARQEFWDTMRADAADGRTIVFATHYLAEADAFADRTVLMARGRIVPTAPTAEVRAAYGGQTMTFRPPAEVVGVRRHRPGLARRSVRRAVAPLGHHRPRGVQRQPRGRVPRPDRTERAGADRRSPRRGGHCDEHQHRPPRDTGVAPAAAARPSAVDLRPARPAAPAARQDGDVLHRRRCRRSCSSSSAWATTRRTAAPTSRCTSWSRWRRTAPSRRPRPSPAPPRPSRRWAGADSSALTPLRPLTFVAIKTAVAMVGRRRPDRADLHDRRGHRLAGDGATGAGQRCIVWLGSACSRSTASP